jgi:hypothetical protein
MVRSLRRAAVVATVGLFGLLAAGCGGGEDLPPTGSTTPAGPSTPATVTATTTPGPTASPTPTTDPAIVFAADGIGPYIIGRMLSDLPVTGVFESELCTDSKGAEGTGRYAGQLSFSFIGNRLVAVHTTSTTLVTPSGARVGMTIDQIEGIYGSRGTLITGTLGNKAFIVRVPASGLAIVFFLDPSNTRVASMSGGEAQRLEDAARAGEGC